MMNDLRGKDNLRAGILFLIWPVLALTESIRNYRESWAKNVIWLFVIFFGFTFVPQEGNDAMGYIRRLQELHVSDISLSQIFGMLYVEGSRYLDVIQILITFLVSRFTADSRILFAVFGALFGFFYSRNIWTLISATEGKLGSIEKILLVIFAFVIPIWYINGIRFWTAAHIFIFGAIQVLMYKNMKGFLIAAFSVLMHFSFALPMFLLGAYVLIGNRTTLYFGFFLVSLLISGLDPLFLREALLQYLPDIFHHRITSYTNVDRIAEISDAYASATFYARWYKPVMKIGISSLLIMIFISGKKFWKEKQVQNMYSFALLFTGVVNMISSVSSLGRFDKVAQTMVIASVFLFFYHVPKTHPSRKWFYIILPFLFFYFATICRMGLDNTGVYALISNPIFAPFLSNDMAIINLIK